MQVTIELPEIEGFEYTGEYRVPGVDEYYFNNDDSAHLCITKWHKMYKYPILRKLKPKREFKDGAFYPAQMDGLNIVVYADTASSEVLLWTDMEKTYFIESAFDWIGAELEIKWGEG